MRTGFLILGIAVVLAGSAAADQYDYDAAGRLTRVTYSTGRIVEYAYDGNSNVTAVIASLATAVEPSAETPRFVNALSAAFPNPVSGEARLVFSLARSGRATLRFFNVSGRLVRTVVDREYPGGRYEVRIPVAEWPTGIYFYRLQVDGFEATRRLVLLK